MLTMTNLLELLLCFFGRILVWMIFQSQFSIGALYLGIGGVLGYLQDIIVVAPATTWGTENYNEEEPIGASKTIS
jgi:hypothetical protein